VTTVLYDAECSFCRTVLGAILARDRDGRLRPIALQDALAADLLPGMSEQDRFASFHVVEDDGSISSGGEALPKLVSELPRGGGPAALMTAAQALVNAAYELVSRNRSSIGPHVPAGWTARADAGIRRRQAELDADPLDAAAAELSEASA
jgi:predicted DCC family thiol-disulfide oxidoreductase YuxK